MIRDRGAPLWVALLALAAIGCGRVPPEAHGTPGAEAVVQPGATAPIDSTARPGVELGDALAGPALAAALRATRLRPAPGGEVLNDCDEAVTPAVHPVRVGGSVGRAWLVEVGGGPNMLTCYGNAGVAFWLLRREGGAFRVLLADYGLLAILPTEHHGVRDVAVGGPGFRFPVFTWEDSAYRHRGWIPDSLMPPPEGGPDRGAPRPPPPRRSRRR